ncbi:MAG: PEP-CTERM sorting domain-containing protein [Proteobacteria bacterium]|nr:PEP-CTERM sorting domain-containing protein [Pseudomonadota bacterium]
MLFSFAAVGRADDVTNVNLCVIVTCNNLWTYQYNGNLISAAPNTGNTGTGIIFTDWNGADVAISPSGTNYAYPGSATIQLGAIALTSSATVNTLMSNFFGTANAVEAVVTFTNSKGATASFSLVGDQTIRDYNNYIYTNALQGFNSNAALGSVTAQEWWNDQAQLGNDSLQRLDVQSFVLPASWAGTDLVSMTVSNPQSGDWDVLSGVQVVDAGGGGASVPEPATLALFGLGVLGLGLTRRRQC